MTIVPPQNRKVIAEFENRDSKYCCPIVFTLISNQPMIINPTIAIVVVPSALSTKRN